MPVTVRLAHELRHLLEGLANALAIGSPSTPSRPPFRLAASPGWSAPDGAGKSTLLRLLAGLLIPKRAPSGCWGLDPVSEGGIGYMPQQFGLYEDLSVLENLTLYADLRAAYWPERTPTFARLLAFTDLARFTATGGQCSGRMKQKLGLACALLGTRMCLLDGGQVDPISRHALWQMVREQQKGMTRCTISR